MKLSLLVLFLVYVTITQMILSKYQEQVQFTKILNKKLIKNCASMSEGEDMTIQYLED